MTLPVVSVNAVMDGGVIAVGSGDVRLRAVRFSSGSYTAPFWLRSSQGLTQKVDALPWQGVVYAGQIELLSSDPDGGPSAVWFSDWASSTAWNDGGKWSGSGAPQDTVSVVVDASAPSGKYVSVADDNGGDMQHQMFPTTPPTAPSTGQSITWRYYQMVTIPNSVSGDPDTHPVGVAANGNESPTELAIVSQIFTNTSSQYSAQVIVATSSGTRRFATDRNSGAASTVTGTPVWELNKNTWNRFEATFTRQTSTTWSFDIHIYSYSTSNPAGSLLYRTTDFDSEPAAPTTAQINLANAVLHALSSNSVRFTGFSNGHAAWPTSLTEAYRYAAVCAALSTAVGAYPISGEG